MIRQALREGFLRLSSPFRRRRYERDLADELEFHLAMKRSEGKSKQDANREFGGLERWKEVCRDVSGLRLLDEVGQDVTIAIRILRKSPVFTSVAIITLTLALGANTAIFTLFHELISKSIPVPNADRLVLFRIQEEPSGYTFSFPMFRSLEQDSQDLVRAFAFSDRTVNLRTDHGLEAISGELVSGNYFNALGAKPVLGRNIEQRDDRQNAMVAVITAQFLRKYLHNDEKAVGRSIVLNQSVFTVIGILPEGFRGMNRDRAPEVFIPLHAEPLVDSPVSLIAAGYRAWWLSVGGILNDGVSIEKANSFVLARSRELLEAGGIPTSFNIGGRKPSEFHLVAESGANGLSLVRLRYRKPLAVLMGVVASVLLIACLTLTTLLTAQASARTREISTRFALGATRARLIRQLFTESLLLALVGASLGLAAAPAFARTIAAALTPNSGLQFAPLRITPDLSVFAFTAVLAILATVLAGATSAIRSSGPEFQTFLKEGSQAIQGAQRRYLWPKLLLTMVVALSLILSTAAGLLSYSLIKLRNTPLGFDPHGLVFVFSQGKTPNIGQKLLVEYKDAIDQIRSLPYVENASLAAAVPLNGGYIDDEIEVPGGQRHQFQEDSVGPLYFRTLGTPLLAGREFQWIDAKEAGRKIILNSSAARLLFPDGRVLGRHVILKNFEKVDAEVVGVVADSRYSTVREATAPMVYSPAMQSLIPGAALDILIRTRGPVAPLIGAVRKIEERVIPEVSLPAALSMKETIMDSLATERVMSTLVLFFGVVSLLIAGIGLYGTLAYSTQQRTGEIGIRLALGAQRSDIAILVLAENGIIVVAGCLFGVGGSLFVYKAIGTLLYDVSIHDPAVFILSACSLLSIAGLASLLPARRASRINPLSAIRYE